jgi:hypothetical protein
MLSLVLVLSSGCQHSKSCGTWTFTPGPIKPGTQYVATDVPVGIDFNFEPSQCDPPVANCQCDRIVFIQIIRTSNPDVPASGAFKDRYSIAPDYEYFTRQTANGWSIDISAGRKLGYYGLQDDGTPIDSTILIPGRNGPNPVTAHLHDTPSFLSTVRGANLSGTVPHEILFEAIDAAVCVQGDPKCQNKILGILYWRIRADKNNYIKETAGFPDSDYEGYIAEAITAWNDHLHDGATAKTQLPSFTYLTGP